VARVSPPRVTSSRVVYENRWMSVREDRLERADGTPGLYAVVQKRPSAVVVPLHGGEITLVEQYRHPVGERFWELPQGAWDDQSEPNPEDLARGELAEETGLRASSMEHLGRLFFAYGLSDQRFDAWLATGLTPGDQALEPEEEGLRVARFPLEEVRSMLLDGRIADSASVAVLGLLRLRRPELGL
jgi:8-oxo-dGTP pyrophosphatase MutT (NUDIX family)